MRNPVLMAYDELMALPEVPPELVAKATPNYDDLDTPHALYAWGDYAGRWEPLHVEGRWYKRRVK